MSEKETLNVEFFATGDPDKPFGARVTTVIDGRLHELARTGSFYWVNEHTNTYNRDIWASSERQLKKELKRKLKVRKRLLNTEREKERSERRAKEKAERKRERAEVGLLRFEEKSYEVEL